MKSGSRFGWVVEAGIEVSFRCQNAVRRTTIAHFGNDYFKAKVRYKNGRNVVSRQEYTAAWPLKGAADKLTRALTCFSSFREMVEAPSNYRPTLMGGGPYALLAHWYDREQESRGDSRRAFTGTTPAKPEPKPEREHGPDHPELAPELRGAAYHLAEAPAWTRWRHSEPMPARTLAWSVVDGHPCFPCPPRIGDRVRITFNGFGTGTVVAYFRESGFLGIEVEVDKRPDWHIEHNGDEHPHPMVFGAEVEPVLE